MNQLYGDTSFQIYSNGFDKIYSSRVDMDTDILPITEIIKNPETNENEEVVVKEGSGPSYDGVGVGRFVIIQYSDKPDSSPDFTDINSQFMQNLKKDKEKYPEELEDTITGYHATVWQKCYGNIKNEENTIPDDEIENEPQVASEDIETQDNYKYYYQYICSLDSKIYALGAEWLEDAKDNLDAAFNYANDKANAAYNYAVGKANEIEQKYSDLETTLNGVEITLNGVETTLNDLKTSLEENGCRLEPYLAASDIDNDGNDDSLLLGTDLYFGNQTSSSIFTIKNSDTIGVQLNDDNSISFNCLNGGGSGGSSFLNDVLSWNENDNGLYFKNNINKFGVPNSYIEFEQIQNSQNGNLSFFINNTCCLIIDQNRFSIENYIADELNIYSHKQLTLQAENIHLQGYIYTNNNDTDLDQRIESIESNITNINSRIDDIELRIESIEQNIIGVNSSIESIEYNITDIHSSIIDIYSRIQ